MTIFSSVHDIIWYFVWFFALIIPMDLQEALGNLCSGEKKYLDLEVSADIKVKCYEMLQWVLLLCSIQVFHN